MDFNVTVILEFYGLPGSGKSTISHRVASKLKKEGKKIYEPTYVTDHIYSIRKRKIIKFIQLIRYVITRPDKYRKLKRIIKENGYRGKDIIVHMANIAPKLIVYDKAYEDYIIFDEGLVQSAVSLVRGQQIGSENEIRLRELCKSRSVLKFYLKIDIKKAIERMSLRDKHDSRIEAISDIKQKEKLLKTLEEQYDGVTYNYVINNKSIDESVKHILRYIQELNDITML